MRADAVERRGVLQQHDLEPGLAQGLEALPTVSRVRVERAHDDGLDPARDDGVDARRRLPARAAWLQRDDERVPLVPWNGRRGGGLQRSELRVVLAPRLVEAARHDLAASDHGGADAGVRRDLEPECARALAELLEERPPSGIVQGFEYASEQLFMQLATERGYYGFMAADRMGVAYQFQHESTAVDESMLLEIAARTDLVRAREWFLVGMHSKGRTEWARAVHGLDPTERVHATVLAHRWGWHSRAIATAAQSGLMDDLTIRYPTSVVDWFESTAATALADSALILGVARTESLFMPDVGSSAGALGLMQIMPATGRRTARELNLRYRGRATLLDPYSNVRLGSHYLGHLLERFAENPVLATAAYNAGPHRVERWLPEGTVLPADIWIDTIPFRETRRYVRRVLTSQAIFRWRMDGSLHRITTSMPPVPPRHLLESVAGGNAGESSL